MMEAVKAKLLLWFPSHRCLLLRNSRALLHIDAKWPADPNQLCDNST